MKKKISLLIADDDTDDRELFIDAVRQVDEDIECITAKDGFHALELLKASDILPDYIFLDLRMPRFNGKKCLFELKQEERLKNIPVVIYTTSRDVQEAQELKKMGALYFVSKPSNPEEIYYLVAFVLEEQWNLSKSKEQLD
jgi:DNA-binding NtrC family response regulator